MSKVDMTAVHAAIAVWKAASDKAKIAVAAEYAAREALTTAGFPAGLIEGSGNKLDVGFNITLKMTGNVSRSVDRAVLDARIAANLIRPDIIEAVIDFKPDLKVGAWKTLPAADKILFADIVTEKPGKPKVELVETVPKK